jgi:hypothetical protein
MKAPRLRTLLTTKLGYVEDASSGRVAPEARGSRKANRDFAFHDGDELGGWMVRQFLVRQVQLTVEEAKEVVRRG